MINFAVVPEPGESAERLLKRFQRPSKEFAAELRRRSAFVPKSKRRRAKSIRASARRGGSKPVFLRRGSPEYYGD
jgi:ribosomal protein S21